MGRRRAEYWANFQSKPLGVRVPFDYEKNHDISEKYLLLTHSAEANTLAQLPPCCARHRVNHTSSVPSFENTLSCLTQIASNYTVKVKAVLSQFVSS